MCVCVCMCVCVSVGVCVYVCVCVCVCIYYGRYGISLYIDYILITNILMYSYMSKYRSVNIQIEIQLYSYLIYI